MTRMKGKNYYEDSIPFIYELHFSLFPFFMKFSEEARNVMVSEAFIQFHCICI